MMSQTRYELVEAHLNRDWQVMDALRKTKALDVRTSRGRGWPLRLEKFAAEGAAGTGWLPRISGRQCCLQHWKRVWWESRGVADRLGDGASALQVRATAAHEQSIMVRSGYPRG